MNYRFVIDPRIRYSYATWYIYGMQKIYGKKAIHFDVKPFLDIQFSDFSHYISGMPVIVIDENHKQKKIFIDYGDYTTIFKDRYTWCDIYAKVNPTIEQVKVLSKIIAIGPGFGIQIASIPSILILAVKNYLRSRKYLNLSIKTFISTYAYSFIRRRPCKYYTNNDIIESDYIFHASTLWAKQYMDKTTNLFRAQYIKICKQIGLQVDGGLYYIGNTSKIEMKNYSKYLELYKEFIIKHRISPDKYIKGIKKSFVAFNTPAVGMCHGWKLAEYLCMGKAIISTPLTREMPSSLKHGVHAHFVQSIEDIYEAVLLIQNDDKYRQKLEKGARLYYEQWLAPEVVVKRLIDAVPKILL